MIQKIKEILAEIKGKDPEEVEVTGRVKIEHKGPDGELKDEQVREF